MKSTLRYRSAAGLTGHWIQKNRRQKRLPMKSPQDWEASDVPGLGQISLKTRGVRRLGKLSPDAVKMMAQHMSWVIRGPSHPCPQWPARIQVETRSRRYEGLDDGAQKIVMNRLRMAEARAAATRLARDDEHGVYSQEAKRPARKLSGYQICSHAPKFENQRGDCCV